MLLIAAAHPSDQVLVFKVILLPAVGISMAQLDHLAEIRHQRAVSHGVAVVVGIEHTGDTLLPQQNQCIGQRFEPVVHKRFQALAVLGIMVIDKGHGIHGPLPCQCMVENGAQIVILARLGGIEDVVVQRHVKECHLVVHRIQIVQQAFDFTAPVFADSGQCNLLLFTEIVQQLPVKRKADVFDGVQPQAVDARLIQIPFEPALGFLHDGGIGHIHIHPHQIVEGAVFRIGLRCPVLSGKTVDVAGLLAVFVPVGACEMPVIPGKAAVGTVAAGERELRPGLDFLPAADLFPAVFGVVCNSGDLLQLIPAHAVVEHNIGKNTDAGCVESPNRLEVFFFGSVLCADRSLLVKLPEIIHIVNAVTHVLLRGALVGRGQPDLRDAQRGQVFRLRGTALPPQSVIRQIPFKILHHGFVLTHHIPSFHCLMSFARFTTIQVNCQIFRVKTAFL